MGLESLQGFQVVALAGERDMNSASAHGPQQRREQDYFISPVEVTSPQLFYLRLSLTGKAVVWGLIETSQLSLGLLLFCQ